MKFTFVMSVMVLVPYVTLAMDQKTSSNFDFKAIDKGSWADFFMIQNWKNAQKNPLPTRVDPRIQKSAYSINQEQDVLHHEDDRELATMLVAGDGLLAEQSCTIL